MAKGVDAGTARGIWTKALAILLAVLLVSSLLLANAIHVRIPQTSEESSDAIANNYLYAHTDYAQLPAGERLKRVLGQLSIHTANQQSLENHYAKASVLIGQGRNEEALIHINTCLALVGKSGDAYEELLMKQGCLRALLEDYEGAQASFEKVLEVAPDNAQAWLLQTQLLIQAGDAAVAMEHLRAYLSLEKGDAGQLAVMAQLCFGEGAYTDVNAFVGTNEEGAPQKYTLQSVESGAGYRLVEKKIKILQLEFTYYVLQLLVAGRAVIHLEAGEQITLKEFKHEGLDVYRVSKDLMISTEATVIKTVWDLDNEGVFLPEGPHTEFRYDLNTGDASILRKDDQGKTVSSLAYDKQSGNTTLSGLQHLARLSEFVARGADGNYYYHNGTNWVKAAHSSDGTGRITITYDGATLMTIHREGSITYHTEFAILSRALATKPLVRVGSDGSVLWVDDTLPEMIKQLQLPGTDYLISLLAGSSVVLNMADPNGSLLDGDTPKGRAETTDILATDGNIAIISQTTGTIGTEDDLLDMELLSPTGRLILLDHNGDTTIWSDTYLFVPNGDMELHPFQRVVGAKYTVVTHDGNIIGYDLLVKNNGARSGVLILVTNQREIKDNAGKVIGFEPNNAATSSGSILFHNIRIIQSELLFIAAGDIVVEEDLDWYVVSGIENKITPVGIESESGKINWTAGGDIRVVNGISLTSSDMDFAAGGRILADKTGSVESTITWTAVDDILFDSIVAKGSFITLDAGGDIDQWQGVLCGEYGARPFIKYADGDADGTAGITLAVTGNIAFEAARLIVDIPAEVTLSIPRVKDLHIDALELILGNINQQDPTKYDEVVVGDTPIMGVDTVLHPDNPKLNEFIGRDTVDHQTELDGDHLKWIEAQMIKAGLGTDTADAIAAWIMERAARGEWTAALSKSVVEGLLGAAKVSEGIPVEWVAELLGNARILAALPVDAVTALAGELLQRGLDGAAIPSEVTARLTPQQLQGIFVGLSDEQKTAAGLTQTDTTITAVQLALLIEGGHGIALNDLSAYLDDPFLAELLLRSDSSKAAEATQTLLSDRLGDVYDWIFGNGGAVLETDPNALPDPREKAPVSGGYQLEYVNAHGLLTRLLTLQLTKVQKPDASGRPVWADGPQCIPNLGEYLGSLLTAVDIEALYKAALDASVYPKREAENGLVDPAPRAFNVHIGTSAGTTNLYNDGDIALTLDNGSLTVDTITSERRNVTVVVSGGDINGYYHNGIHAGHHILGRNISLAASGSIVGLLLEQRENSPLIVVGVNEDMYHDPNYIKKIEVGLTEFDPTAPAKQYILRQVEALDHNGKPLLDQNRNPLLRWILDVEVRYDWIREDYPDPEPRMTLTVVAGGDVSLEELTGSVRGSVTAGGDVEYTVNDGEVGTYGDPLLTDITGTLTIHAQDDISVKDVGNLTLIANSTMGQVNAEAAGNIILSNSIGKDLVIGPVKAGDNVEIVAGAALVEGVRYDERAQVIANSILLTANGQIGTRENPFDIDTNNGGILRATGTAIAINEVTGDMLLDGIVATVGDVVLSAAGNIFDMGSAGAALADAAKAQQEANAAKDAADAATDRAAVLDVQATRREAERLAAEKARQDAEKALQAAKDRMTEIGGILSRVQAIEGDGTLTDTEKDIQIAALLGVDTIEGLMREQSGLQAGLNGLSAGVTAAKEAAIEAERAAQEARQNANTAAIIALQLQQEANVKQGQAAQALGTAQALRPTILQPGDLFLAAGDQIGTPHQPVSLTAGGSITAGAPNGVYLAGYGDLNIEKIQTGGNIELTTDGSIVGVGSTMMIAGNSVALNALGGSVGNVGAPLKLNASGLTGSALVDFYVDNAGSLTIGAIHAGGNAGLRVGGSVTALPGGQANITAETLALVVGGNVGSGTDPLRLNVDHTTLEGGNMNLAFLSDVTIHTIAGGNIMIDAASNIWGDPNTPPDQYHIIGQSVNLNAFGDVGTELVPVRICILGRVEITSHGDGIRRGIRLDPPHTNLERVPLTLAKPPALSKPGQTNTPGMTETDDSLWNIRCVLLWILILILVLCLVMLIVRRRRKRD